MQRIINCMRHRLKRGGGGGAPFDIASLFANGELGGLYNPSNIGSLWQDTAGTVPVTATGQEVARIDDLSGNGNHLIRGASGSAYYRVDGNGKPYVELAAIVNGAFDAVSGIPGGTGNNFNPLIHVAALMKMTSNTGGAVFGNAAGNPRGRGAIWPISSQIQAYWQQGTTTPTSTWASYSAGNSYSIQVAQQNSADGSTGVTGNILRVDGTEYGYSYNDGGNQTGSIRLGVRRDIDTGIETHFYGGFARIPLSFPDATTLSNVDTWLSGLIT